MSKICQLELDIFSPTASTITAAQSPTVDQHTPSPKPVPFRWPGAVAFENSNSRTKLADNMAALRLLCQLRQEERKAGQGEQETLAKYNGWGGLALVFEPNPREWSNEAEELQTMLSPTDYSSAQATVTSAFYTPHGLCGGIYEALRDWDSLVARSSNHPPGPAFSSRRNRRTGPATGRRSNSIRLPGAFLNGCSHRRTCKSVVCKTPRSPTRAMISS
jgi:hypothetical protein